LQGHGPVGELVLARLSKAFSPERLELVNESNRHSVPEGSESHFKLFIVSEAFEGVPLVQRHRMVNEALKDLLEAGRAGGGIHALSVQAKTPAQAAGASMQATPGCRGGSKDE
jgi:stress-induced morphogen